MFNPPRSSAQSDFLSPEDLHTWGYDTSAGDGNNILYHFPDMCTSLGIDREDSNYVQEVHDPTNAKFASTFSLRAGLIVAENNRSPSRV
jgi:hypothetical protein